MTRRTALGGFWGYRASICSASSFSISADCCWSAAKVESETSPLVQLGKCLLHILNLTQQREDPRLWRPSGTSNPVLIKKICGFRMIDRHGCVSQGREGSGSAFQSSDLLAAALGHLPKLGKCRSKPAYVVLFFVVDLRIYDFAL